MLPKHYIFDHFPKTGGISLLEVCRKNLGPEEISPHLTDHEIRLMPAARFEHYKLIAGHVSIGALAGFCRSRYRLTLLREPIKRIFSAYTYWRTASERNPATNKAKELSFADFVRYFVDSPSIIHNPYTHHFAAIERDCPGYPADTAALLGSAKRNLSAFDFVGICEDLDTSSRLLCQELGWPSPVAIPHENRSSSENWFGEIDDETMGLLRDRNQLDLQLYECAVQRFNARKAGGVDGSGFVEGFAARHFMPFAVHHMNRRATIQSVSATWVPDESAKTLEVGVTFRVHTQIAGLSLGLQVNDTLGKVVWGTSTAHQNLALDYQVDSECHGAFRMHCELPRGIYFVTAAVSEPRRLGFHDHWIDHATSFTVAPPQVASSRYARGMHTRGFRSTTCA